MSSANEPLLFSVPADDGAHANPPLVPNALVGIPRLRLPERAQVAFRCESLDQRLPLDHLARTLWRLVDAMNLEPLYQSIRAVEGGVGRDATDPRILLALWLYAFSQSETSARRVARLCTTDRAYEWLCGGVSLNHRLVSDFRVAHWDVLNQIFTDTLGTLQHEGLLDLTSTAQDGMRVRASAGSGSFRREPTLTQHLALAEAHVARLHAEAQTDPGQEGRQQQAAQQRAAAERQQRVVAALEQVQLLQAQREQRKKGTGCEARASTTDPEARRMKMPDGGFRPAFNVQFATAVGSGLIVGVDVNNQGSDSNGMEPMLAQIEERTGATPQHHLTDAGYYSLDDIDKASARGATVYTPLKDETKKLQAGLDPYTAQPKDSTAVADWRERMGTAAGKTMYKLRGQTAELSNAQARNRGLYQVRVRGLAKVKMIALWYALIHNLLLAETLRARRAATAES